MMRGLRLCHLGMLDVLRMRGFGGFGDMHRAAAEQSTACRED
ncbi:MAG: hypothetical protein ABJA20_11540 [Novosphingobium sp.]